jgi:glycosyltransferase involved in cell wall biosynthesis
MKLLVFTQVVDREDLVLGFFCRWIEELATRFEHVHVICLKEGIHDFPQNVQVHSLGKEKGVGRLTYLYRFYTYLFRLRDEYDSVFVHMNQEYVLLGGIFWKFLGKSVYMWRNHYAGSWLTNVAALFCTKVFCTSKHSYTARFRRTVLMPVGIDYQHFSSVEGVVREPRSVLFLARISPSKRPEMLIDALGEVLARGISFTATIVGSPKEGDESYAKSLQTRAESLGLHDRVQFRPGVPVSETPRVFAAHDIFVNCSPSGMFDKTLFEAAAAGCRVLASSEDFRDAAGDDTYTPTTKILTQLLIDILQQDENSIIRKRNVLRSLALGESLQTLADRLHIEIQPNKS